MTLGPFVRYLYANVPGIASACATIRDLTAARFAKPEYRPIAQLSVENPVIVDIGADRGRSIAAFRALARRPRIVAFDPESIYAAPLVRRYRSSPSVTIHACALGSHSGDITFYAPSYGRWHCDGMSARDRNAAVGWLSEPGAVYHFDRRKLRVHEYSIPCRTLDSFRLSPTLIKLDARGAEFSILQGAVQTLEQNRPALMCAFATAEITYFLARLGFDPYVYGSLGFTGGVAIRPMIYTWYLDRHHLRETFAPY
jgi:FkbM family methyltransferase